MIGKRVTIHRKFMETLELIENDWSDCANSDLHLMTRKAKISDRITNVILILHTSSIVAYCLGVIVADADVTDKTTMLPFASKMDFYYITNTQNVYRSVLIVEFIHMICCNWVIGIVNAMLLSLVSVSAVNKPHEQIYNCTYTCNVHTHNNTRNNKFYPNIFRCCMQVAK